MTVKDLNQLVDFEELKRQLDVERKTIIKVNNFSEEDGYVRSLEDATLILDFLSKLLSPLWELFNTYPSLMTFFQNDYLNFNFLIKRENILDLVFLEDCLIPEKEMFFFGQDGGINSKILDIHIAGFRRWSEEKKSHHELTQELVKNGDISEVKASELKCQCFVCVGDFRAKTRDLIFDDCLKIVEATQAEIEQNLDVAITQASDKFTSMQKDLDKTFYKARFRLKRSSLNRIETQIKDIIKSKFSYPSPLTVNYRSKIRILFDEILVSEDYNVDLITEDEYDKFFISLGVNIWKNEKFLDREFKKFIKSIVILKKKDVSSKILQEYLGEFWVHSTARQIKRKIVYHMGPTNSGKTYHAIEKLASVKKGCYLAPLRLLAAELYDTLNNKGVVTTLLTGEEVIEKEGATHYSSTIEMARLSEFFDCCVIDEIQMIADSQRGWAWTRALVNIFADEVHICGDASALDLIKVIVDLCGDELEIKNYERKTELAIQRHPVVLADLEKHDALIVFSRRNALRYKRDLERIGYKVSIVYGRLSPEVRREQARKFDQGETDIMVSTDAIAMGMNLPIRRVVFSTLTKYVDNQEFDISISEIKQIAGRAGRFQRFPKGFVTCINKVEDGIERIKEAIDATLDQSEKCMVGPDLDIFNQVNTALISNNLPRLQLSEFLRLFNTMTFKQPFFCVDLKEMIELAEAVEDADKNHILSDAEIFGFACAPVNLGLIEHVQYYMWVLNKYVSSEGIPSDPIDFNSNDIDYLETSIKCVELYQWLSRHFNDKHFVYDDYTLLNNKQMAIDKLNNLLSEKTVPTCSSCGCKLPDNFQFAICENCFDRRRSRHARFDKNSKDGDSKRSSGRDRFSKRSSDDKKGGAGKKSFGGRPGAGSRPSGNNFSKKPSRKRNSR